MSRASVDFPRPRADDGQRLARLGVQREALNHGCQRAMRREAHILDRQLTPRPRQRHGLGVKGRLVDQRAQPLPALAGVTSCFHVEWIVPGCQRPRHDDGSCGHSARAKLMPGDQKRARREDRDLQQQPQELADRGQQAGRAVASC